MSKVVQVVVAGHICLDIIPTFESRCGPTEMRLAPGKLIEVGPAVVSTGGAVSNTGLALHRLGIPTKLIGKVGDDLFGTAILDVIRRHDDSLVRGMIISPEESTSYTVVISPPGTDRTFLHCSGANDAFGAADVGLDQFAGVRIFHFGYPPVMRRMYADGGIELARLMGRAKAKGLTTSLDVTYPDPASEAGQIDWTALLKRVLPQVDVFLPSLDETLFMCDRRRHDTMIEAATGELAASCNGGILFSLTDRLLHMGVAVAGLKLGSQGLYARTSSEVERMRSMASATPPDIDNWVGRELFVPCFQTDVVGTAGAGDCTIAGFLAAMLKGLPIEDTITSSAGVGAFNVERPDATSGVPDWNTVRARVDDGWDPLPFSLSLEGWQHDPDKGIWFGPNDRVGT